MLTRRLYTRIYLHFLGVLVVVAIATALVFATSAQVEWRRNAITHLCRHVASLVAGNLDDRPRLDRLLGRLASELAIDVTVFDPAGKPLAVYGESPANLPPERLAEALVQPVHLHRATFAAAPIRREPFGPPLGVIALSARRSLHDLRVPILAVLVVLGIAGLATLPLARRISRPIEALTAASRRLGDGDLSYRVPIAETARAEDEVTRLALTWNQMAERVETLVRGHKDLLANVSHELRSPLARVRVALALVPRTDESAARLEGVEADIGDLDRLIDDVLMASRLEAGGLPIALAELDVAELLEQLAERARADARLAGAEVHVEAPAGLRLVADGALLRRALWNLVDNAAKYGAPPLVLRADVVGERVRLAVVDAGPGIPPEERERVLEAFYRAERARTPEVGASRGVGLGLTIAARIASAHRGTIRVEPGPAGHGCCMVIELPVGSTGKSGEAV